MAGAVLTDSTFFGDLAGILLSKVSPVFGRDPTESTTGGMNGRVLSNQEI
jgi:hypothetical protein